MENGTDTLYTCPNGHEVSCRFSIIVVDNGLSLEALPYAGNYCFVCFAAWVARNVPRSIEIEKPHVEDD